jgi:hypothetical protein
MMKNSVHSDISYENISDFSSGDSYEISDANASESESGTSDCDVTAIRSGTGM